MTVVRGGRQGVCPAGLGGGGGAGPVVLVGGGWQAGSAGEGKHWREPIGREP